MEDGYSEAYGKCPKCGGYKIEQKSELYTPSSNNNSGELSILSKVVIIIIVGVVGFVISFVLAAFVSLFSETRGKWIFILGIIFTVGLIIWDLFIPKKVIQRKSYLTYCSRCCICGYKGTGTWAPNPDD